MTRKTFFRSLFCAIVAPVVARTLSAVEPVLLNRVDDIDRIELVQWVNWLINQSRAKGILYPQ